MRSDIFEKYPIPKAVWSLALPTMAGMLVIVLYNLADTFFVGQLNDPNQVAAVVIATPIFLLLMAFGNLFGIGGGAHISRMLGARETDKARQASSFAFYASLAVGVICGVMGLIFMPQILKAGGANEATYTYAASYLSIIAWGAPSIVLSNAMGQIVRAEGAAKEAMIGMILGTVINIILDPILISAAGMGVAGAAIATIISNIVSVLYYGYFFIQKNSVLSISPRLFSLDRKMLGKIFAIGVPTAIANILMSVSTMIQNNFAAAYNNNVVAALGVVSRVMMLPILLLIGLGQGIQPLLGYNYAAKKSQRFNGVFRYAAIAGTLVGCTFTVIYFFAGSQLVRLFIDNAQVIELGSRFIRINLIALPFIAFQFVAISSFQALGRGVPSLILSISRQGLIFLPVLIAGNALIGMSGLVLAQPVADILASGLSIVLFSFSLRKTGLHPGQKQETPAEEPAVG